MFNLPELTLRLISFPKKPFECFSLSVSPHFTNGHNPEGLMQELKRLLVISHDEFGFVRLCSGAL